jgi:hypothetical protein
MDLYKFKTPSKANIDVNTYNMGTTSGLTDEGIANLVHFRKDIEGAFLPGCASIYDEPSLR